MLDDMAFPVATSSTQLGIGITFLGFRSKV